MRTPLLRFIQRTARPLLTVVLALITGGTLRAAADPRAAETGPAGSLTGSWQPRSAMPTARVWTRCVSLGDKVYVLGGRTGWGRAAQPTQVLEAYDPKTDRWAVCAPPPNADVLSSAAQVGARILYFQRQPGLLGFEYDPASDGWSPRAGSNADFYPAPHNAAAVCAGRLFAVHTVRHNGQVFANLLEYDYAQQRWTDRGRVPSGAGGAVLVAREKLCLVGGGSTGSDAAEYDPATGLWTSLPALNTGRIEVRCAEWKGRIVAVGGHTPRTSVTLDVVEAYDWATHRWTPLPSLPERRWGAGVAVCAGRLFVFGGCPESKGNSEAAATVWEFVPDKS